MNVSRKRGNIDFVISELRKSVLKPNADHIEKDQFYTFQMDKIKKVKEWHKYLFYAGVVLTCVLLVMFVVFLVKCLCKTTFFLLCCPCWRQKESKRLKPLHITNGQGMVIIRE